MRRLSEFASMIAVIACARTVVVSSTPAVAAPTTPASVPQSTTPAPAAALPPLSPPPTSPQASAALPPSEPTAQPRAVPRTGDAELPRTRPAAPEGLDRRACTVRVREDLQSALAAAKGGDVICLAPGAAFLGTFQVAGRRDTGWVVLRTDPAVPLGDGRMRPSQSTRLARIVSTSTTAALRFTAGAARWHVLGVEVTSDSTLVQGPVALVELGTGRERSLGDLPDQVSFDRVYIHGWSKQHVRRAFSANGRAFMLTRSWCEEIHASGFDSQCVISWAGPGPMLIEDNHLAAASENLMFGGGDPRIPGLVPADITIRRNHITKALAWKGGRWNVKNLVETKASARVLVEDNVLENSWTDGQTGYAFVLKSTTQAGSCRPCSSSDWTIRRNLVRNTGAGFSVAGRAEQRANTQTDSSNRRFVITENWVGPLSVPPFGGDGRPVIFVAENHDITFTRNVFEPGGRIRDAIIFDISGPIKVAVSNLTLAGNLFPRGEYGMGATGVGEGLRAWRVGATGRSTWSRNAFMGNTTTAYPPGTTWHNNMAQALGAVGLSRKAIDAAVAGVVVER